MNSSIWIFWLLLILMTGIAVLVSALPWIRPRPRSSTEQENLNLAVYRDRLRELETALDYPLLTFEQREVERLKLKRELIADIKPPLTPKANATGRWALFVIITVLPLLAGLLYFLLGTGTALFSPISEAQNAATPTPSLEPLVTKLAARLAANPNDSHGWIMLGRSYMVLERYPEAVAAYAQAFAIVGEKNSELTADYIEALIIANGNRILEPVPSLLTKLLQEAPDYPKGLWLAGIWAFQEERYQAALDFWQRCKSLLPEDSEFIEKIDSAIADAKNSLHQ